MQDYKKLVVWQKAHALSLVIYKITYGSASEVEYLILLSAELNYVPFGIAIKLGEKNNETTILLT